MSSPFAHGDGRIEKVRPQLPTIQVNKVKALEDLGRGVELWQESYTLLGMTVFQQGSWEGEQRVSEDKFSHIMNISKGDNTYQRGSLVMASWDIPRRPDGSPVRMRTVGMVTMFRHPWRAETEATELVLGVHFENRDNVMWMGFDDVVPFQMPEPP